jgi:hypothetical protein
MVMPDCPYVLGDAGRAWWDWAWKTPQAKKWDAGVLFTVARRAMLEDVIEMLEAVEDFDLESFMAQDPVEAVGQLKWMLETLKAAAGGVLAVSREMRELESQLGFGAKSMAALGWKPDEEKPKGSKVDELRARRNQKALGATA